MPSKNTILAWTNEHEVTRYVLDATDIWETSPIQGPTIWDLHGKKPFDWIRDHHGGSGLQIAYANRDAGQYHPRFYMGGWYLNPLKWDDVFSYVGFPAFLKPFDGGGWRDVYQVGSPEEFFAAYDKTGTLCMTLQEFIDFDQFVRCYCVGQQEVMIMAYDPRKPYLSGEQYIHDPNYLDAKLADRVRKDVRTLCTALGYDLNTVEFAIKDGVPYAIDFMNPAPDAELASVGEFYHNWITGGTFVSRNCGSTGFVDIDDIVGHDPRRLVHLAHHG